MTPAPQYAERDRRAARLLGERPQAGELLAFYRQILTQQERIYRESAGSGAGVDGERSAAAAGGFLELPWEALVEEFRGFVRALAPAAPEPTRVAGDRLAAAPGESLAEALARTARREQPAGGLADLGVPSSAAELYCRAFLQPWAESASGARARAGVDNGGETASSCPHCGWPAQVSVLYDDDEGSNRRALVCALCGYAWTFRRVRCAGCGEESAERLALQEIEGVPHLLIETCESCKCYLKRVDLRRLGDAVPVVEDLSTPELDLWAAEQGFGKVCRNLLAL